MENAAKFEIQKGLEVKIDTYTEFGRRATHPKGWFKDFALQENELLVYDSEGYWNSQEGNSLKFLALICMFMDIY